MKTEFITIKTTPVSLTRLRTIAALTGEKQFEVMERLTQQELVKVKSKIPA